MQRKNHFTDVSKMVLYEVVMNEQEKSSNRLYYIAVIIVVLSACYFLFCGGAGEGLYNYSDRADELGSRIKQSVQSNRELQSQIDGATATTDKITDSINRSEAAVSDAARTAESLDGDIDIAADAITKCQRIVNGIKQRNEAAAAQP